MTSASEATSRREPDWYANVYRWPDGTQFVGGPFRGRAAMEIAAAFSGTRNRVFILRIWEKAK